MRRFRIALSLLACLQFLPTLGHAAFPFDTSILTGDKTAVSTPAASKKTFGEDEITALRAQTEQEIEQAKAALPQSPESASQTVNSALGTRLQLLDSLNMILGDILDSLAAQKKVQDRIKGVDAEAEQWNSGTPPKDFTVDFATLDKLRGQEVEAQKAFKSRMQVYQSRQDAMEEARKDFQSAEQERRQAKEAAETAREPSEKASAEQALSLAQLKSKVAEYRAAFRELEFDIAKSYREFFEKQQHLTSLQISFLEKRVKFTEDDLKREQNLLQEEAAKVAKRIEQDQKSLASSQKDYEKSRERLDEDKAPDSALIEEVEARRLAQSLLELEIGQSQDRLKEIKDLNTYWQRRFSLLNNQVDKKEIAVWQQETQQRLDQMKRDEELSNLRLTSLRNNLVDVEEKIRSKGDADPQTKRWLQAQNDSLQATISMLQDRMASQAITRKLNEKFLVEQELRYSHVSLRERLERIWDKAVRVWNYEITSVDDSPITVSKVFFALILMIFGLILAKRLSNTLAERLLPRFGVAPGVAAALKTLMYYALVLLFILTALHLVRVPLTLFAVLGGAVAIGIGFGSQNLMNNFISGLILLIERPIKMGDIVEMEGTAGIVEQIGGRSTQIRTFSNIHMIVPNSSFLEKSVTNWTLSDNMVRSSVKVGVAYGTSTRQVVDLLKKAAESHGKILKTPEPIVLFTDFGSDALVFELYFWLRIQTALERRVVESDLRFMIEGSFTEAGIDMAFPQRELHLNSENPIPIRLSLEDSEKK